MATLTIDLPDTPRPQAAYRLAADCPHCGAPLVLRQNRQTGVLFTGCSAYPVAYLGAADNVSRLPPSRLREVNQPVIRTLNGFSSPRPRLLACL